MFSIEKLEYESLINLVCDLLNTKSSVNFKRYDIPNTHHSNRLLWSGYVLPDTGRKIICEVKNFHLSDFELFEQIDNYSVSILNEFDMDEFWFVIPKALSKRRQDEIISRINLKFQKKVTIIDLDELNKLIEENPDITDNYRKKIDTWHEAYNYIARILTKFYENNSDEPARAIYDRMEETEYLLHNSSRLFQDDSKPNEKGLDPIQLFASFNYSRINSDERCKNINLLLRGLNADKRINSIIDFEGCPTPIIAQIIYKRNINVQNKIWDAFAAIMGSNNVDGLTEEHFSSIDGWYGIGLPAFTIFLFWIKSEIFIPLDQNTSTFIVGFRIVESTPNNYESYKELCKKLRDPSFGAVASDKNLIRDIVKEAYFFVPKGSSHITPDTSVIKLLEAMKKENSKISVEEFEELSKHNFKIIGIRPLYSEEGKDQKHIKNLVNNNTYHFYNSYKIENDDTITHIPSGADNLYNIDNKRVSISAIVGKNGSGKSTITELLYLIINKLSVAKGYESEIALVEEPIYASLYFKSDTFYKIKVGSEIEIWKYRYLVKENKFIIDSKIIGNKEQLKLFAFNKLFYSIVINYSLYGLNSKHLGLWIKSLFHKNDGYQIPIVLNPKRVKGNVNVNEEEYLAKCRLLSNILEPNRPEIIAENKVPQLLPGKSPVKLHLSVDRKKQLKKRKKYFQGKDSLSQEDKFNIKQIIKFLNINEVKAKDCIDEIEEFIYCKLISIKDYPQFADYKDIYSNGEFDISRIESYLESILKDRSHATFKIKQAINYLKCGIYSNSGRNNVLECIKSISVAMGLASDEHYLKYKIRRNFRTVEFAPPSFFKFNILFETDSSTKNSFDKMSSGEKQQVLSINTILYHLLNLNSIEDTEEIVHYRYINIIFDEVELYFHPDMQRTYISKLLDEIEKLQLENISDININFVTHSPFILSDIPKSNILMLETDIETGKSMSIENSEQTFGANVHDLLHNEFFLKTTFMGEFAKKEINDLILHLTGAESEKKWDKDSARNFIEIIGEPYLKSDLLDLYHQFYLINKNDIDREIEILQKKREQLDI